jgi:hypothetical protein
MVRRRFEAALATLRRIVDGHPERMEAAFTALTSLLREMLADKARPHGEPLRPIVAEARKAAETLSREPKAHLARVLVTVDSELDRTRDSYPWRTRLSEFASEYAGTEAALLAEVDLLTDRIGPPMLAALDEFVKAHQVTTAAAKALYTKGFHLGHNAMSFGARPGHDPTERFFQVRAIASELRSGRYPPCEWVDKAQSLVVQFFAYKPVPGSSGIPSMSATPSFNRRVAASSSRTGGTASDGMARIHPTSW